MTDRTDQDDLARRVARLERRLARERAARKESERIAEDALRRMYEANELKTVLLGTVSHELRTPATVLHGLASLLLTQWDHVDDAWRVEIAERIATNAASLAQLVERVLELARLERGVEQAAPEQVDLAAWLPAVLDELGQLSDAHDLRLDVDDGLVVSIVPTALHHILSNLVANAQRYAPEGTRIDVTARRLGHEVEVVVEDEGPGVDVEDRARIFEPFYRAPGDHVTRTSGFGIGLAVVRRLAAVLDAPVDVGSSPSGGARFWLRLPGPDEVRGQMGA